MTCSIEDGFFTERRSDFRALQGPDRYMRYDFFFLWLEGKVRAEDRGAGSWEGNGIG